MLVSKEGRKRERRRKRGRQGEVGEYVREEIETGVRVECMSDVVDGCKWTPVE